MMIEQETLMPRSRFRMPKMDPITKWSRLTDEEQDEEGEKEREREREKRERGKNYESNRPLLK